MKPLITSHPRSSSFVSFSYHGSQIGFQSNLLSHTHTTANSWSVLQFIHVLISVRILYPSTILFRSTYSRGLHIFSKQVQKATTTTRRRLSWKIGKRIALKIRIPKIHQHDPTELVILHSCNPVQFVTNIGHCASMSRIEQTFRRRSAVQMMSPAGPNAPFGTRNTFTFSVEAFQSRCVNNQRMLT